MHIYFLLLSLVENTGKNVITTIARLLEIAMQNKIFLEKNKLSKLILKV